MSLASRIKLKPKKVSLDVEKAILVPLAIFIAKYYKMKFKTVLNKLHSGDKKFIGEYIQMNNTVRAISTLLLSLQFLAVSGYAVYLIDGVLTKAFNDKEFKKTLKLFNKESASCIESYSTDSVMLKLIITTFITSFVDVPFYKVANKLNLMKHIKAIPHTALMIKLSIDTLKELDRDPMVLLNSVLGYQLNPQNEYYKATVTAYKAGVKIISKITRFILMRPKRKSAVEKTKILTKEVIIMGATIKFKVPHPALLKGGYRLIDTGIMIFKAVKNRAHVDVTRQAAGLLFLVVFNSMLRLVTIDLAKRILTHKLIKISSIKQFLKSFIIYAIVYPISIIVTSCLLTNLSTRVILKLIKPDKRNQVLFERLLKRDEDKDNIKDDKDEQI